MAFGNSKNGSFSGPQAVGRDFIHEILFVIVLK